jgi:hypothetical protein
VDAPASPQLFYLVMLVALPVAGSCCFAVCPTLCGEARVEYSVKRYGAGIVFWLLAFWRSRFSRCCPTFHAPLMESTFFLSDGLFLVGLWSWNVCARAASIQRAPDVLL